MPLTVFELLIPEFAADYLAILIRIGAALGGKDNLKTQISKTEKYGRGSRGSRNQKQLLVNTRSKLLDQTAEVADLNFDPETC
jgi:hypothetical protein